MTAGQLLLNLSRLFNQLNDGIALLPLNLKRLTGHRKIHLALDLRLFNRAGCCNGEVVHSVSFNRPAAMSSG